MRLRSIFSAPRRLRELNQTIDSLRAEIAALRLQEHTRAIESLRAELAAFRGQTKPLTWVPPGHFYSPLVDPNDDVVRDVLAHAVSKGLPHSEDIRLDVPLILSWFEKISSHYKQMPFPQERQPGFRYCYENGMFSYSDAISLFGMLLELSPRQLIEVGSGHSSCVAMDTNDLFLNRSMKMKFIEPYPQRLLSILQPEDSYRSCVEQVRLQNAPLEWFTKLEAGDVLFIDSSHVGKLGSDVNHYFFAIFPVLASGVYIHIHDVFYPFEYPSAWIIEQNRSWNEAYLLHAFLQYNSAYEIVYFNDYMFRQHRGLLESKMPMCLKNGGGSIWLRKK
jgi:methyltransferase family protein